MSVRLSPLFSDGMVLQRDMPVQVWGESDGPVTVSLLGNTASAAPDAGGHWRAELPPMGPGGPFTMAVNDIRINGVYVGDVWLCSGQSNMELPMRRLKHVYPEEMETADNPAIRQFAVPIRTGFHGPQRLEGGAWCGVTPQNIENFSGVGYFFAKRLYERYRVPVGIILCAVGGATIHAWMGRDTLKGYPDLLEEADRFADDGYVSGVLGENAAGQQAFFAAVDACDPGLKGRWFEPEYDDSAWEERDLLEPFPGTGSVWLRRTVDIPKELDGMPATLFLGSVIDWDMAWVNGMAAGNTTYRYPPREYPVASLRAERNVVAVRVIRRDGGCFTKGKQYLMSTTRGSFDLSGAWKRKKGGTALPPPAEVAFYRPGTGLYNAMLAPLIGYAVKGALWYQGESDAGSPAGYADKMEALIRSWRAAWGYDFPFLFVELAHWEGGANWHLLRAQQRKALRVPRSAMAAAYDLGEDNDLHPLNKQAVGDRLARCARRVAYGETMPPSPYEIFLFNK